MKYLHSLFIFLYYTLRLWRPVASNKQDSSVGAASESVNVTGLEKCEFPLVSTVLFADRDSREVNLTYLNSSLNLNVEQSFPYQYFMLTCSASYPIEWVVDVPEPHYYSYILNEEIRTNVSFNDEPLKDGANDKTKDNARYGKEETYIVRHHIGNETLGKDTLNLTYDCQPVQGETEAYLREYPRPCGNTLFQLKKHDKEHKAWNKTTLDILFNEVTLASSDFANASINGRDEKLCLKDEKWPSAQRQNLSESTSGNKENETFICTSSEYQYPTESTAFSVQQLQLNVSNLVQEPFGILQCTATHTNNETQNESNFFHVPYYFSLPKLCSTEDSSLPHLYLRHSQANATFCFASDLANEEELLSLCVQNTAPHASDIYVGDEIAVTCISAIYYFAEGMRVQVTNMSSDPEGTEKTSQIVISKDVKERSFGPGGYRNLTTIYKIQTTDIKKLQCLAPFRKSRKWVAKTVALDVKVPQKLSFDGKSETATTEGSETYLLCNATGDPIPTLSWSRLNNGKLPANQTTEIHNFSNHPTPGQPSKNKSGSTWISSKLHLPPEKELAEYYGRYICTARNRFQSIEKVLLYDKEEPFSAFSQNAILRTIGKTVWFWVLVVLAMFVLIGLVIVLGLKVREQTRNLRIFTKTEIDEFMFGKPELLLDDSDNYEEINSYASYLPYDRNQFEIRREQIEFNTTDILGSGAYGTVYKGTFTDNGKCQTVAIKTVNPTSDKMYFAALLSEIKIMCYIGENENVVRLIGACTKYLDRRQIFVATEFCENGDLLSYIQKHRETFINNAGIEQTLAEAETGEKGPAQASYIRLSYSRLLLSPRLLLVWALQITKGMAFLSSKKVIHGDLAARNILLGTDLQPKLGDFGLSKQLQNYANYVQKGDDLVPWKWLAIECLQFMKFSLKSDVWAFGVVLYEILTLGKVPYANYTYSELFIVALCHGERLPKPLFATDKLYDLMLDCWKHSPEDRPTFTALENALKILILENESISCNSTRSDLPIGETTARRPPQEANPYVNTYQIPPTNSSYMKSFNVDADNSVVCQPTPPQTLSYVADWNTVM